MISFDELSDDEKAKIIWYNGKFIASVYSETTKFNLFSLSGMMIEVRFNRHTDEPEGISVLEEKELERYVDAVELAEMLN